MKAQYWGLKGMLVALLMLVLAGSGMAQIPLFPLTVTVGGRCVCHIPMDVGVVKGIFEKHGIKLGILRLPSGFEGMLAVQSGSAQVADAQLAPLAQAWSQDVRLKAILFSNGDPTGKVEADKYFAVIARKGSGIREGHLEDLKGKRIGLPRGTIAHQYLYYAFLAKGLDPERDISIQHLSPLDLPSALQSGSVDAIVIWEPIALQALEMMNDAFTVYRGGRHIQFLVPRLVSPRYIATNPGTVKKFIAAFAEAQQYVRLHPDETVDIFMKTYPGLTRATVQKSLAFLVFDMRLSKSVMKGAQQDLEFAVKGAGVKQVPPLKEMTDFRFLELVLKEHPEFFNDLQPIPDSLKF